MNTKLDPELKAQFKRASHRAATVSGIGAVIIFGAIIYAGYKLHSLNATVTVQKKQVDTSVQLAQQYKEQVDNLAQALDFTTSGVTALQKHDYAKAISYYDRALAHSPHDPGILNLKGYALFKLRKYDDAAAVLNRSIMGDLSNPWPELNLAKVQCANQKYVEAKAAIKFIIVNEPGFIDTVLGDGEFTRVCKPIMSWVSKEVKKSEERQ